MIEDHPSLPEITLWIEGGWKIYRDEEIGYWRKGTKEILAEEHDYHALRVFDEMMDCIERHGRLSLAKVRKKLIGQELVLFNSAVELWHYMRDSDLGKPIDF